MILGSIYLIVYISFINSDFYQHSSKEGGIVIFPQMEILNPENHTVLINGHPNDTVNLVVEQREDGVHIFSKDNITIIYRD